MDAHRLERTPLALAVLLAACAGTRAPSPLLRDVRALVALDGRAAGSDGERAAAAYAVDRLRALGLSPVEQAVPAYGSVNVHAVLDGDHPGEVIVVGAHLDHLGVGHPGADDNASGVAMVLAVAEALVARQAELGRSVMFALFGAEEVGMVGSRHFVTEPPVPLERIPVMVNLDMVGRPLLDQRKFRAPLYLIGVDRDRATGLVGTRRYPGLRALADAAFAAEGHELVAAEDFPARIDPLIERAASGRGDSVAFEERGIPALFFGDGESDDYHAPGDTIDELSSELLDRRARAVTRVIIALSHAPADAFARSEVAPPRRKPPRGLYLPFGVVTGAAFAPDASYFVGAEVSAIYLGRSLVYGGVYADAIRDTGAGVTRVSFGPELGRGLFGVDAGYVVELDGGEVTDRGGAVRAFFGVSPLTVTARAGYLRDGGGFAELGVAIKLPLRFSRR